MTTPPALHGAAVDAERLPPEPAPPELSTDDSLYNSSSPSNRGPANPLSQSSFHVPSPMHQDLLISPDTESPEHRFDQQLSQRFLRDIIDQGQEQHLMPEVKQLTPVYVGMRSNSSTLLPPAMYDIGPHGKKTSRHKSLLII